VNYLRNTWYAAAYSSELTTEPLARKLLDEDIVLFRKTSGSLAALEDRCPHRFAPLSRGKVIGDSLECGYHGLRFAGTGACSHNPHGPILPRARVRHYTVAERYGIVWLWPGEAERSDPTLLPKLEFLDDHANYKVIPGYLHVKANYQLIVDNLLDLSHALYVHPHFAIQGQTVEEQLAAVQTKTVVDSNCVTAWRLRSGVPPNGPTREIFGFGPELVDSRSHMRWHPPSNLDFDVGSCLVGTPEEQGLCIPQAHLITPETETTSHYFFCATHNLRRDDPAVSRKLFETLDLAFRQQDEPMIEAVQAKMGASSDLDAFNPLLLRIDGAPAAARRILKRLVEAEQAEHERPDAPSSRRSG
jgi:phenylpropionate dioxygenase-like ring-hydroxylating dioxygenase large terminal subunit